MSMTLRVNGEEDALEMVRFLSGSPKAKTTLGKMDKARLSMIPPIETAPNRKDKR